MYQLQPPRRRVNKTVGGSEGNGDVTHRGRQADLRYAGCLATSWETTMRLIIEARVEDPDARGATGGAVTLAVVERRKGSLAELGLALAEGRDLLARAQSALVSQ